MKDQIRAKYTKTVHLYPHCGTQVITNSNEVFAHIKGMALFVSDNYNLNMLHVHINRDDSISENRNGERSIYNFQFKNISTK